MGRIARHPDAVAAPAQRVWKMLKTKELICKQWNQRIWKVLKTKGEIWLIPPGVFARRVHKLMKIKGGVLENVSRVHIMLKRKGPFRSIEVEIRRAKRERTFIGDFTTVS